MKKISSFLIILAGVFWGSQGIFVNGLGEIFSIVVLNAKMPMKRKT